MEDSIKINKVQIRTLQMEDYEQLSQSFTRVYSDGSDVFWTRGQIQKLITLFPEGQIVTVVDDKIVGLITDGDIRRAMEKWQAQFFDRTVADIMTRQPKVVPPEMKISEIQGIMNKYKIHTVLVVDNENHLLGVVDHYRCML